jgi:hypothetical protein
VSQDVGSARGIAIAALVVGIVALGFALAGFGLGVTPKPVAPPKPPSPSPPPPWTCRNETLNLTGPCVVLVVAKICKSGLMASLYLPFWYCTITSLAPFWQANLPLSMDPGLDYDEVAAPGLGLLLTNPGPAYPSTVTNFANDTTVLAGIGLVIHQPTDAVPTIELGIPLTATSAFIPPLGQTWGSYLTFQLVYATNNTLPP